MDHEYSALARPATVGMFLVVARMQTSRGLATRTKLHPADIAGVPETDGVVARLTLQPGGTLPLHSHPGDDLLLVPRWAPP